MTDKPTIYFIRNPKFILKQYGPVVSTYLGFLIDQDELRQNTRKNYKGSFYISRNQIAEETTLKRKAQMSCERILKEAGFIAIITEEHNANKFTINYEALAQANLNTLTDETIHQEDGQKLFDEQAPPSKQPAPEEGYAPAIEEEAPCSLGMEGVPTAEGVNYISTRSSSITVSRSADTYVSNETESIDSAQNLNTSGIKNIKHSCIKNTSDTKAPERSAPIGTGDEVQDIVNQYNTAIGLPQAKGDYEAVFKNLDKFRQIRKYFTPKALDLAWKNFGDNTASKLEKKRISALVSYKVLDPFVRRRNEIYTYMADYWDNQLDKLYKTHCNMINELIPEQYQVNRFGELEVNGCYAANVKADRKNRIEVYKQFIEPKLLPDEDLHDMIIDMEVPEWII